MNVSSTKPPRIRSLVLIALLAFGLVTVPAGLAQAAGGDDVTWTVRTGSNGFGADRTSFSYTIDPGGTLDDSLVIANHGDGPLDLGVYAADGYTTQSGQFDLVVGGAKSTSIGVWVRSSAPKITVPAARPCRSRSR